MEVKAKIGQRIKDLREQSDMSQKELHILPSLIVVTLRVWRMVVGR